MKNLIFVSLIIVLTISCTHSNTAQQVPKKTYKLYFARLTGINYPVSLWINGKIVSNGIPKWGKGATIWNYMLVSSFEQQKKTVFKVNTMYKDTVFSYKTDSVEELYIWLPDESIKHFEIDDDKTINNHPLVE
jgi:hypothetical protein